VQEFLSEKVAGRFCGAGVNDHPGMEVGLRARARELIRSGKVPSRLPSRRWGGRGTGDPCTLCGKPVEPSEVGFEIDFGADGDGGCSHDFHDHCLAAVEHELRALGEDGPQASA
jgi:hypothetical protein